MAASTASSATAALSALTPAAARATAPPAVSSAMVPSARRTNHVAVHRRRGQLAAGATKLERVHLSRHATTREALRPLLSAHRTSLYAREGCADGGEGGHVVEAQVHARDIELPRHLTRLARALFTRARAAGRTTASLQVLRRVVHQGVLAILHTLK